MVVEGTLSCTEFYVAASSFSELWRKFNSSLPQCTWVPSPKRQWVPHNQEDGYLSVEKVILPRLSEEDHLEGDQIEKEECNCTDEDELIDSAAVLVQNYRADHYYDFHIVYSASYMVPVLYFRSYDYDGQLRALYDIEKDISNNSAQLLTRSKWTFITQEEHPHLNRPWYILHPCGTSGWMKLLLLQLNEPAEGRVSPVENYLISWFSVVGQVFGLKIPSHMLLDMNNSI